MINYKPLGSKVIIRILDKSKVTIGGQELTIARAKNNHEWKDAVLKAEVLKIGPNVTDVEVGEIVGISGSAGRWLDEDLYAGSTGTHRIIEEDEVLFVDETPSEKEILHV